MTQEQYQQTIGQELQQQALNILVQSLAAAKVQIEALEAELKGLKDGAVVPTA